MSEDELFQLSPVEVVAHVRRLEARIAELEAELARRGGPPKTSANSSTPPRKGWKRERHRAPDGAKRGPRSAIRGRVGPGWSRTGSCSASRLIVEPVGRPWPSPRRSGWG